MCHWESAGATGPSTDAAFHSHVGKCPVTLWKINKLQANVRYLQYKCACVLKLMETWLKDHDLQSDKEIEGFGEPTQLEVVPLHE